MADSYCTSAPEGPGGRRENGAGLCAIMRTGVRRQMRRAEHGRAG